MKACREVSTRPYSVVFPGHLFIVLHVQESPDAPPAKLGFFLAPDYLVTVHATPLAFLQAVKDRIQRDAQLMRSTDQAVGLIMQTIADCQDPLVAELAVEAMPPDQDLEARWIYDRQRRLNDMIHLVKPQCDIVHSLYAGEKLSLQADAVVQLQDAYHRFRNMADALTRTWEMLNDAAMAAQTKALRSIDASSRRMTFLVALLLPVLVIAVLLGIDDPPMSNMATPAVLGIGLAVSLLVAIVLVLTARKR
ncbi:MAG: hypothetical protein F4014_12710 [Gemmatimonadetes bacterium]|nr:hypothetical protein [Gemmatimonadota bacterium]